MTKSESDSPQLSLFLVNACSVLEEMPSLRLSALSSDNDLLLITEILLIDNTPDDAIATPGYQAYRKSRPSQLEGGCLVYARNSIPAALCQDFLLNCIQNALWLRADIGRENVVMGCVCRPPGPCRNDFQILSDVINQSPTLSGP